MKLRCAIWLALVAGSTASQAAVELEEYRPVDRDSIRAESLSEIGRMVLDISGGVFGSNQYVLAYAATHPELARLIKEAAYARIELDMLFGTNDASAGAAIFIASVGDDAVWHAIVQSHGLRRDGLAMRLGREIYFQSGDLPENRPDRIMHEMVHVRLGDFYPSIPHALDEGLASYLGWTFAARYQSGKNLSLVRRHPPLQEKDLYTLEELLTLRDYPRGKSRIHALYRQSELLIEQLVERGGMSGLKKIMNELAANPSDPVATFRASSGMNGDEEQAIMDAIKVKVLAGSTGQW